MDPAPALGVEATAPPPGEPLFQKSIIYFNFDGSLLSEVQIDQVMSLVQADFAGFPRLTLTRVPTLLQFAVNGKQLVEVKSLYPPYSDIVVFYLPDGTTFTSNPAGLAVIGSMFTRFFDYSVKVFTAKIDYDVQKTADVLTHEIGHAMGLNHYPVSHGPSIMNVSPTHIFTPSAGWSSGTNVQFQPQSDVAQCAAKLMAPSPTYHPQGPVVPD